MLEVMFFFLKTHYRDNHHLKNKVLIKLGPVKP